MQAYSNQALILPWVETRNIDILQLLGPEGSPYHPFTPGDPQLPILELETNASHLGLETSISTPCDPTLQTCHPTPH